MTTFPQCTAELVLDAAEAVVLSNDSCDCKYVAEFINHPEPPTSNALTIAVSLGLISVSGTTYSSSPPYSYYLAEASEPRRIDVLRFALEAYPPYRFFKQRLSIHSDSMKAAGEVKARFQFTNHPSEIKESLVSLGQYCGSLTYGTTAGLQVASASRDAEQYLASFEAIASEGVSAEDFIREKLGTTAYAYVQDESLNIVTNLRGAIQKLLAGETGRDIVVLTCNACENFQTKIATDQVPPVNLAGANGVISKAERLKTAKAIAGKHLGFFQFIGNARNATDHGIDPDTGGEWSVSESTVRQVVLVTLAAIKSVVAHKQKDFIL